MKTLLLQSTDSDIQTAASLLRDGQLVAFPTETVYGLGADIYCQEAVERIYSVKGRPSDNPLIVHIAHEQELDLLAESLSQDTWKLFHTFFPGPLTLVLKRKHTIPDTVSKGLQTIAIRMPAHPAARTLIQKTGHPIAAPSANLSGKPSPTTAQHVLDDLGGSIAAVVDGGNCQVGIESTVIDMTKEIPVVVRPGYITLQELSNVLQKEIRRYTPNAHGDPIISPGMKYKHYAPDATIHIIDSNRLENFPIANSVILSNIDVLQGKHSIVFPLTTQTLFHGFRLADKEGYNSVTIIIDPESKKNEGLMNRIQKAAAE